MARGFLAILLGGSVLLLAGCAATRTGHFGWLPNREPLVTLIVTESHEVVARLTREAASLGVTVSGAELVGLVPEHVLRAAGAAGATLPGIDESDVLERRLATSF